MLNHLGLYIHFPWCKSKCPYCDFLSYPQYEKSDDDFVLYIEHVLQDLRQDLLWLQEHNYIYQINTIYIGGGTPSLLPIKSIYKLVTEIYKLCNMATYVEISIEANPGTLTKQYCSQLLQTGVNRVSLGVQSFNNKQLQIIKRKHDKAVAINSCKLLQDTGFSNINFDLMFGLPEQTLATAMDDLNQAICLNPAHISWYQFTLEPQTVFYRCPPKNIPNQELLWQIDQSGKEFLSKHGFNQYEISAYCRDDLQCKHNLNYWLFGDYLGIGVGSHGKITLTKNDTSHHQIIRYSKNKFPQKYQQATVRKEFLQEEYLLAENKLIGEFMLNTLRLYKSINLELFKKTTGLNSDILYPKLQEALSLNLLTILPNNIIVTTEHGRNFLTDLMEIFI